MPVDTVTVHIEYIPDDQPLVTLTIGTPETGVSIEDSTLFPTPSQHAAGDWRTQQGGNSYSSLQYFSSQKLLLFSNQVSGSGGDSTVNHAYNGSDAEYLVEVLARLYATVRNGIRFQLPTAPSNIQADVSISNSNL